MLIVTKGGSEVLLNHREETPGDHVNNEEILRTLGVTLAKYVTIEITNMSLSIIAKSS